MLGNGSIGEHSFTNLVQRTLSVSDGSGAKIYRTRRSRSGFVTQLTSLSHYQMLKSSDYACENFSL